LLLLLAVGCCLLCVVCCLFVVCCLPCRVGTQPYTVYPNPTPCRVGPQPYAV
jgi:hypothetical protein